MERLPKKLDQIARNIALDVCAGQICGLNCDFCQVAKDYIWKIDEISLDAWEIERILFDLSLYKIELFESNQIDEQHFIKIKQDGI